MKPCIQFLSIVEGIRWRFGEAQPLRCLPRPGVKGRAATRCPELLALEDDVGKRLATKEVATTRRHKKVTRAAALQESLSFSDAWAARNRGRIDIWFVIGLLFILLPLGILIWGIATGVIPFAS
jgi:hypothetical protein